MPKQKDLKRLVRARMQKTGESYTAARAQLLVDARPSADAETGAGDPPAAVPMPADYEKLAGMSDGAVLKASGRTWPEWASYLDAIDAVSMDHRDIAAHIDEHSDAGEWWSQMITVAYERFRGLRDYGQRRGGGYDVNRSRTVAVHVHELWQAFADDSRRAEWLDDAELSFHLQTRPKSMRGSRSDGTKVDVYFTDKGDEKSSVSVQHRELPDKQTAEGMKVVWAERLDRLKSLLNS